MKTNLSRSITFKDGLTWAEGDPVIITVSNDRPMLALLENRQGEVKKVRSRHLHLWFNEFQAITMDDLEQATFDGISPSLTGEDVEPDGWDSEGMPSILLACGLC